MGVSERFFQLGSQWNIIHLPQKPNGFGILIHGNHWGCEDAVFSAKQLVHHTLK